MVPNSLRNAIGGRFGVDLRVGEQAPNFEDSHTGWVAPNAVLVGDVAVGRDVTVWFGAVVRGDVEKVTIGSGTNIQDQSVMHADPGFPVMIGRDCTIGHRALVHGCVIGENCLIGMGAIILNGARIGANSLVGAGALVTEGKEFPENALILGSPARMVRLLTDEEVQRNRSAAKHYVANGQRYKNSLS